MPLPSTVDIAKEHLFSSMDEMVDAGVPELIRTRIIRLRDIYHYWLLYPSTSEKELVEELMQRFPISRSTAYEDLKIIKLLLGNLQKTSKDFHRWKFLQRNQETWEKAKQLGDARAMAACDNYYGKYTQLDKEDAEERGYDKIVVQPFVPSTDPTILGIKPIPNIRERIKEKINKYWNEDIEDIDYEDADYNEDDIFIPKKIDEKEQP